uniref:Dmx like 2 n=1 Tax=Propithecus coquereli TaxID=379532 RepID=A0A2K6FM10_PROCO
MHLHQVLTGAVNPGDNCYSVGSVGDVPFTAYGSGCDIVILANDFECVQIIPGAKHGNIQVSCVECSNQHGRIAASYGNAVCIFEPLGINSHKRNCQLKCQWLKTGQFFLSSVTYNLAWDPQDNRLLTATDSVQLWAPPGGDILEEEEEIDNKIPVLNDWKCIWQCKTSVSVHLMEWSPDGEYFATAGKDDCLLKVWYPMTGWKSSIIPQDHHEVKRRQASTQFSFVYLAHPRAVTGFSWRKTSKYMPRGSVCNVLLTSCHDGVCRLWAETLLPEDCLLGEQICETTTSSIASNLPHAGRHKDRIQHALETIHHLKNLRKGQRRSSVLVTHTELTPDQMATHEVQRHISHHANALCHFHIAASINPATVNSIHTRKLGLLTIGTVLIRWNRITGLFPVDKCSVMQTIYAESYNCVFQVSFSSRIPVAFPSGDASSLSKNIMMYACVNASKDSRHTLLHREMMSVDSPHGSQPHSRSHSTNMNILAPTVMMVSKHIDGSLNQWAVTFADKSAFTTVLTVSHKFRYCGHRFHLNDLACHSVLPLLLTSSHHNALLTPESDCQWDSDNKLSRLMDPVKHLKGSSKQPLRNAATRTFHDPNAIYSELILWRVDPIGPLSYTGGVSELARINSLHTSAFSNVAWLPTLIPSYCLGTYCNSASACFVASDGKNLRLYQAVVDARKLLDELSDPESSKLIGEVFNIVSQQSTARPGCIIELDAITDQVKTCLDTLDECGLRYLLAMRLHTCLLTSLPPLYRVQLLHQDLRLLFKMIIIVFSSILSKRIIVEKVPWADEKNVNSALFGWNVLSQHDEKMTTFFSHNFNEDRKQSIKYFFYNYLRTHPLLIRRNLASPEGTLATLGLKTEKNFVDKINLIERKLFFTTANAHFKVGCPVLALEVLSKIPKVTKTSALPAKKDQPDFISKKMADTPSQSKALSDGNGSSSIDWSNVTSSQYDWSQPIVKVDEEPLTLDWGEDHDSALDEEEEDAGGLVMKSTDARGKDRQEDQKSLDPNTLLTPQEEDCLEGDTEVDVIAEQLKFRACLKILMTELRTLATGYEVDGGKLRFQLYNWLEKEIAALHDICNHESVIKEYSSKTYSKVESDLLDHEEMVDKPDIGSYERHQIERRRLQAKREHAERRKLWLQKNQDLLRVFLSYCSLHGAQGGGLASVRMELKFLLQESQQETTVKQLQSPLPLPTTLPLLSASIASTKTVIANPVLYLNNHIHDILYTIVQMKTPPHPSIEDVKVHTLHSLAASLSASIYQALCDSHSYSQTEGNQFTGMAYQGLLLSDRRRLRTESIEEHATPNSSPAQWPGVSSLINLLSSAQDEDQPKLNILLCEAVVAVYLSLLIHALATNSSNELFRLAAHPLNNRMWAAVFGGGVKLVVKPRRQSENISAPPVSSEDIDKHRRRFNMRMLVPGRPVKDATPPPVPAERPSYKEKFIPPELSMWDYFVAKVRRVWNIGFSLSVSILLTLVLGTIISTKNLKLPVTSPLGIAVIKNLENWEQILQEKMDQFEGPPPNYINTYPTDLSVGAGPAILRNKAMLEPENTPFKSRDSSALPVKRLWHFLVKQEVLQETFIRYIFTKKRKQSEVEADLGYPGGKAKVIHKESDMIMAFSVNKANYNEIVLASTHDVQELDVTSLLACQSYIWIGEEYDRESKSSDDIDYRGSTTTLYQPSATSYSASQVHPPSSLPWLGSGQTSTGASVLMKRNLHNVKRMTSHPVHQYYLTGAQDGSVRMFEWTRPQQLVCFRQAGNARVTRLYFNSQGNKCGVADGEGFLSIWQVNQTAANPKPYMSWQCHSKSTSDFAFITSSSLVATSGQSNDNRNVCLWDTLISPGNSLIHGFTCHDHGATVLQYAPKQQLLISGGRKGYVCVFDIRQRQLIHTFQAHDSAIKALALDPYEEYFTTGSAEGNIKVWRLTGHGLIHSFKNEHAKQSIFRNIGAGVMQIDIIQGNRIFSCGADGTLKTRVLPNAFNIPNRILDIL